MLEEGTTCWRLETAARACVLVDMEPYLAAAREAMLNARHRIHFLNWAFDPDTVLLPKDEGPSPECERVGPFLKSLKAARPDLEIRILCWQSALPVAATQRFFPVRSRTFFAGSGIEFVLDGTLPMGASHHQKVVVIDDAVAFCGSCDIGPDRWDSPEHLHLDPRRLKVGQKDACYDCRHEVMAMVDGGAADALGELFRDRWHRATGEGLPPLEGLEGDPWPSRCTPDFTDVTVGVSRTYAGWRAWPEVREGEIASLAAIAAAEQTIYMENQYFTSPIIAEALAQRLEEPAGPEVVLVSTLRSPSYFDKMTMDQTRALFLKRLKASDHHNRLFAYSPVTKEGETIIVHAKLAIIDDRFIRLGSSNANNRSEGFDSECDLTLDAVSGGTDASRVEVTRTRDCLVAHWLGCDSEIVQDACIREGGLGKAIEALRPHGQDRLRPLSSATPGPLASFVATHHLGDPISSRDSFRPWHRRALMRHKLAHAVRRLERADLPAPDVSLSEAE